MLKKYQCKINSYIADDYILEIHEGEDIYEAWLKHKDYGISISMFGLLKSQYNYGEFLEIAEANLDDHIKLYESLYIN